SAWTEGQLECAVAAEIMCAMLGRQRFVAPLPGVDDAGAGDPAPRVGGLIRKAMRQPLRHRYVERVICGVVGVCKEQCLAELRIGYDQVFIKSVLSDVVARKTAGRS